MEHKVGWFTTVLWAREVAANMPRSDEEALEEYLAAKLLEFIEKEL